MIERCALRNLTLLSQCHLTDGLDVLHFCVFILWYFDVWYFLSTVRVQWSCISLLRWDIEFMSCIYTCTYVYIIYYIYIYISGGYNGGPWDHVTPGVTGKRCRRWSGTNHLVRARDDDVRIVWRNAHNNTKPNANWFPAMLTDTDVNTRNIS